MTSNLAPTALRPCVRKRPFGQQFDVRLKNDEILVAQLGCLPSLVGNRIRHRTEGHPKMKPKPGRRDGFDQAAAHCLHGSKDAVLATPRVASPSSSLPFE